VTSPDHDPSIEHEPHLRRTPPISDPSEPRAESRLDAEKTRLDPDEERARHSVFDEPAMLPGRDRVVIEQDWYCRHCGYNQRGLLTGHPCPECGVVERYEPPRENEASYAKWAAMRKGSLSPAHFMILLGASAVVMVPTAAVCSFLLIEQLLFFMFCLMGPIIAEIAKLAPALFVTERTGRLGSSAWHIYSIAGLCALVFAVVQSFLNVTLFHKNAPVELVAFRWTVGPVMHMICTFIGARGLAQVTDLRTTPGTFETLGRLTSSLTVPILIHVIWNVVVFMGGYFGYGF